MPQPGSDKERLVVALEVGLLDPLVRSSPAQLEALIDEDFVEIGPTGTLHDKEQVIKLLLGEAGKASKTVLAEDFQVRWLADDMVLLTYRTSHPYEVAPQKCIRSSIWKQRGSNWVLMFHQGTLAR